MPQKCIHVCVGGVHAQANKEIHQCVLTNKPACLILLLLLFGTAHQSHNISIKICQQPFDPQTIAMAISYHLH